MEKRYLYRFYLLLNYFCKGFVKIFRGYVDDPRNTDNAWIETVVYNFHDEDRSGFKGIKLQAGDDATHAVWTDVSSELELYANHKEFLHQAVLRLDAHW